MSTSRRGRAAASAARLSRKGPTGDVPWARIRPTGPLALLSLEPLDLSHYYYCYCYCYCYCYYYYYYYYYYYLTWVGEGLKIRA